MGQPKKLISNFVTIKIFPGNEEKGEKYQASTCIICFCTFPNSSL